MMHPSRWSPQSREYAWRRREFRRMVAALERGRLPGEIAGDRDVLVAALEHVQRAADVADDLPRGR